MTHRFRALLLAGSLAFFAAPGSAASLTNLEMLGRYSDLKREVAEQMKAVPAPTTTHLAHLCVALSRLKDYRELADCLAKLDAKIQQGDVVQQADFIFVNAGNVRALYHILRAETFIDFGDYAAAIAEARQGLAKLPGPRQLELWGRSKCEIHLHTSLAVASALGGDRASALRHMEALRNVDLIFPVRGTQVPLRDNGLARGYMALGDYAKAIPLIASDGFALTRGLVDLLSGLALRGDSIGKFTQIPRSLMLAKSLKETGKLAEARELIDRLLDERLLADQADVLWLALHERGGIAESERQPAAALGFYQRAIEVIERQRASINTEASKIGFVGDKQAVYGRVVALLVDAGRTAEAFDYVERSKSRALVDMLAQKKDLAPSVADPQKARLILAQLDAADLAARVQDESAKPEDGSGSRNLQAALVEIRAAAPELSTLVSVSSVPTEELKRLVGEQEALVEYYYEGKDLYAFVLTRESLQALKLDAEGLVEEVQALRRGVEAPGTEDWKAPAAALHERLWKPASALVGTRARIVVPHGVLHYLPFAALRKPDGGLLIDEAALRLLPSASVLKFLKRPTPGRPALLLVLGNPDLGDPAMDLKFAEGEARRVGAIHPDSRILLRKDASETNFKNAGTVFSHIHFASHGKFQADDPLRSGLFLAKDADNDGLLTVGELYSMALDADLVTLSACETGLGKIANGDDVVGLTRGFLYAGSRSIVASLWSVDDQATAELMQAFYANLSKMPKQDALRHAQLEARRSFPHPFFWAAFQLTGSAE